MLQVTGGWYYHHLPVQRLLFKPDVDGLLYLSLSNHESLFPSVQKHPSYLQPMSTMTPNLQNRPYFGEVHFFGKNILFYVRQLECLFPDSLIFITFFLTFFIYLFVYTGSPNETQCLIYERDLFLWAFFLRGPALNNYIEIWHLTFHDIQHITTAEKSVKSMNL